MSVLPRVVVAPLMAVLLVAATTAAEPGTSDPRSDNEPVADATPEPYAKVLARLVKDWPADLSVSFMVSSGGVPPSVTKWQVDAKGVGTFTRVSYPSGKQKTETWPVALSLANLKALLAALCAVDFENTRHPVPGSPVQIVGITSGGRTGSVDTFGLVEPRPPAAVQRKVFDLINKLRDQAENAKRKPAK